MFCYLFQLKRVEEHTSQKTISSHKIMSGEDVLRGIERATKEGRLWEPEQLVDDLLLSQYTEYRQRQVLLGQAALAIEKGDGIWLLSVSGFCYQSGFGWASDGWIERHIGVIPSWAYHHSGRPSLRDTWRSEDTLEGASGTSRSRSASGTSRSRSVRATGQVTRIVTRSTGQSPSASGGERKGAVQEPCEPVRIKEHAMLDPEWREDDRSLKRRRSYSPINWTERKVAYGRGCWQCGEWGHYQRDCRKAQDRRERAESAESTSACDRALEESRGVEIVASTSCGRLPEEGKTPKFKACPVPWCRLNFANKKGHTFGYHYPTGLAKEEGRDTRTDRRIEALKYLARALVGPDATINELVQFLNDSGHLRGREGNAIDEWTDGVIVNISRALGLVAPRTPTCVPLNSPGCIFQYRVMVEVVSLLGERGHYDFMHRFGIPEKEDELDVRCPRPSDYVTPRDASPLRSLRVRRDEGGREVLVVEEQLEVEPCSTSAGMESRTGSTSACTQTEPEWEESPSDYGLPSMSDSSDCISPRRPWRPVASPEPQLSDMVVIDEVGMDEVHEEVDDSRIVEVGKDSLLSSGVDSHFHLDRMCEKLKIKPWDYRKTLQRLKPWRQEERINLMGAVAVWCDPATYPTQGQVASLREEGVVSVVGIHPSKVHESRGVERLKERLDTCDVVGFGEIGLDGTKRDLPLQRKVFGDALGLLVDRPDLVLVLHCRPRPGESSTSAYFDMFYRCKAVLRPEQRIHLHCFSGTMEDVDLWLGYFPNTHFGYSLMVTREDFKADSRAALQRIHSSQLLLESDAPYFSYDHRERWSSPAFVGLTAQEVARVRGCSREELLQVTAKNARRLYWH